MTDQKQYRAMFVIGSAFLMLALIAIPAALMLIFS
jgi:hypothetical protein